MKKNSNLIWIDLEMTGLDVIQNRIIEIATIVTDSDLNILAEGPVFAIYQDEKELAKMDNWNQTHHNQSGLVERVRASKITEVIAETETLDFLKEFVSPQASPICGNSIWQDRRFLERYMPKLERYFHYRQLDVSTLKILAERWAPKIRSDFDKVSTHQALADIRGSIEELAYYRKHFLISEVHDQE